MRRARASPLGARLVRAVLALGLLAALVVVAGEAGTLMASGVFREAANPALWEEGEAEPSSAPLPGFEDEVLVLAGCSDARVDEGAGVVGFSSRNDAEEAFRSVANELTERGWQQTGGGMPAGGTFTKADGAYRWLFVSCTQVGQEASVVVQYAPPMQEGS